MIIVCPLKHARDLAASHKVSHVVSLLAPETPHRSFDGIGRDRHLKLSFHDIASDADGLTPPQARDGERLIRFLRGWNRSSPMLIHCWAGISRSTATAYAAMCLFRPEADEQELAFELRHASPSATPNRLIVSLADGILGRQGRMVQAIERIGRGAEAAEGTPFVVEMTSATQPPARA